MENIADHGFPYVMINEKDFLIPQAVADNIRFRWYLATWEGEMFLDPHAKQRAYPKPDDLVFKLCLLDLEDKTATHLVRAERR